MSARDPAFERVGRLLSVARRVQDPDDPLGRDARQRLPAASGLSPEGVELALADHLEVYAAGSDLEQLCARASRAARCHVVVSANVCTAALRALACALAVSPAVFVRPSRRDPVLAELLVRALAEESVDQTTMEVRLVDEPAPDGGDELHVYGTDETVAVYRTRFPNAILRAHGTGIGVALLGEGVDSAEAAVAIARDIVPFDQRGCLSPRFVLVEGGLERARHLADHLHEALAALGGRIPRGPLDPAMLAEVAAHRSAIEAIGTWREGPHHAVGLDPAPRALPLPPAARIAHVAPLSEQTVASLVGPWARWIAALGTDGGGGAGAAIAALVPRARRSRLGQMQRPPLDGPVDLRTPADPVV